MIGNILKVAFLAVIYFFQFRFIVLSLAFHHLLHESQLPGVHFFILIGGNNSEGDVAYIFNSVADCYGIKACAESERIVIYYGNRIRYGNPLKAGKACKRILVY